ncbi:MAG: prepilin-type N-terminal cleavage/methylation domain-containing protein [Candidatus Kerfeldbacteria bacterium]|nr:prepilin-type N-terminal cleavage/methylation domain-containing protein [Candidatus Kerfeldbacteria bacterium]
MTYSNKHSQPTGFTLIELVVTFSIIVVIAIGVILQVRQQSPTQSLENATDTYRSLFVEMRTNALTSKLCCGISTLPSGYGVTVVLDGLPDNTVITFADWDADDIYTSSVDSVLATTILQDDVSVTGCDDGTNKVTTSPGGTCTVVMRTGGFKGFYYNGGQISATVTLEFTEPDSGTTSQLSIYSATYLIE